MPGASRTRSLACRMRKHTSIVTTGSAGASRHSPRNGFTGSFVLSPATWLCCHRHRRDAKHHRQLDTCLGVSGPHDFAVHIGIARLATPIRPSHPAPNTRDDREAPLLVGAGRREMPLIWGKRQWRTAAADWHDGQITHNARAYFARRASSI